MIYLYSIKVIANDTIAPHVSRYAKDYQNRKFRSIASHSDIVHYFLSWALQICGGQNDDGEGQHLYGYRIFKIQGFN